MMFYVLLSFLFTALLLTTLKIFQYVLIYNSVYKLHGPKRHFIIGNVLLMFVNREQIFKNVCQFAKDYYPAYSIVALTHCSVNIVNDLDAELILSSKKHSRKGRLYNFIRNWLQEGLLTSAGKKWQQRRKLLTPAFHFNLLQDFLKIFQNETEKLIKTIEDFSNKNNEIDVVPIITDYTLFSIAETSMGAKLNLTKKTDKEYHKTILQLGDVISTRFSTIWLYPNFIFYYLSSVGYKENRLVKILHKFSKNIIESKIYTDKMKKSENDSYSAQKRLAMLDLLIAANKKNLIDLKGICEEVHTFMFEGHDTTSMGICFMLLILANHQKEQEKIVQEIEEIIGDGDVSFQNLNEMKYLEMCIKESLRLFPSVPFIARLADEDFYLPSNGHFVKKDTDLHIHIFNIHRDPNIYEDPDKFDPNRFLPENIAKRRAFAYIPFSAGPRNCIGQKYAMLEIKTVIIGILKNFKLEPIDTINSVEILIDLVLRPKNGINIKFVKRH